MNTIYNVILLLSVAVVAYGIFAAFLAIKLLVNRREAEYMEMYRAHLLRRARVEKQLERSRQGG